MEVERNTQCLNCAELWKRLDELTEEKVRTQKKQGAQLALSTILLGLLLVNMILALLAA